jgi:hypothetical protein
MTTLAVLAAALALVAVCGVLVCAASADAPKRLFGAGAALLAAVAAAGLARPDAFVLIAALALLLVGVGALVVVRAAEIFGPDDPAQALDAERRAELAP